MVQPTRTIFFRWRITIELQASPARTSRSSADRMAFVLGGFAVSDIFQGDTGYMACRMDLIFLLRFLAGYDVRRNPAGDFK